MNPVLKAALAFSGKGIPVFPCRDKKPLTENGFKDASTSPAIITKWFDVEDPTLQLAIPTGSKTGMLVIDLDGARPRDRFSLLGTLPDTRMVHTSSGKDGEGEHIQVWLQQPPGAKTKCSQGKLVKGKLTGFGPGIDVRGDGGYVISPP
ncbi:MAG: bifunctional DNA primase/polymerase, partial [Candidatus Acidiferrales bacterium]